MIESCTGVAKKSADKSPAGMVTLAGTVSSVVSLLARVTTYAPVDDPTRVTVPRKGAASSRTELLDNDTCTKTGLTTPLMIVPLF